MKQLKCDYDRRLPRDFARRLTMVVRVHRLRVRWVSLARSGSGRGWHVVVCLTRPIAPMRAVALQAILGSDWKRECYNSRRAAAWRRVPAFWRNRANVLYQRHYRRQTA